MRSRVEYLSLFTHLSTKYSYTDMFICNVLNNININILMK